MHFPTCHTAVLAAAAAELRLHHNEVGSVPQMEAGSSPLPPPLPAPPACHDKTIEYLWSLAEQIMRQGLSCARVELPPRPQILARPMKCNLVYELRAKKVSLPGGGAGAGGGNATATEICAGQNELGTCRTA